MTGAYRGFLALLAAAGGFLVASGLDSKYWRLLGPGPGFFPIWVGGLLTACALAALLQSLVTARTAAGFFATAEGKRRVLQVAFALALLWLGLAIFGFRLATFAFLLVVLGFLGSQSVRVRITSALVLSFGVAYVFERWLGVPLPAPAFEILQGFGL